MTGTQKFTDGFGPQEQAGYSRAVRRGNVVMVEIEAQAVVEP